MTCISADVMRECYASADSPPDASVDFLGICMIGQQAPQRFAAFSCLSCCLPQTCQGISNLQQTAVTLQLSRMGCLEMIADVAGRRWQLAWRRIL